MLILQRGLFCSYGQPDKSAVIVSPEHPKVKQIRCLTEAGMKEGKCHQAVTLPGPGRG